MKAPVNKDQQLEELYKLVSDVHCKGFCQLECRALAIGAVEYVRIRERVGLAALKVRDARDPCRCPLLTKDGKCSVYDIRPLICRQWGGIQSMPCPFGCRPDTGLINAQAADELQNKMHSLTTPVVFVRLGAELPESFSVRRHYTLLATKRLTLRLSSHLFRLSHIWPWWRLIKCRLTKLTVPPSKRTSNRDSAWSLLLYTRWGACTIDLNIWREPIR